MPNKPNAAVALDAAPPAAELLAAQQAGMTYRAWCDAGKPQRGAAIKSPRGDTLAGVRPYAPYRSKWEADYAKHLDALVAARIVAVWRYEPERLEIGVGAVYTPDFSVLVAGADRVEYHEVKGYRREAAIVRIKAAALRYPEFRFVLVTKLHGEWKLTPIGAQP